MHTQPFPDPSLAGIHKQYAALSSNIDLTPLSGKHIFITGGTGFFGYWILNLLDYLAKEGISTRATLLSRRSDRFLERAPFFRDKPWLRWIQGDIKTFRNPGPADLMIHAATETNAAAHANPLAIMDDVLLGTRHALDVASACGVRRMLYVSTGAVYGNQPSNIERITENVTFACDATATTSAYGESKRAAEQWCVQYGRAKNITIPIARCFAFVGAGLPLNGHFAIGNFIRDALEGLPITINGDGTALRSYLYGADLALWLMQILLRGHHGRPYNVGSNEAVSILDLANKTRDVLAPDLSIEIKQKAESDTLRNRYIPDIQRAQRELGLNVWTPLSDAIRLSAISAKR